MKVLINDRISIAITPLQPVLPCGHRQALGHPAQWRGAVTALTAPALPTRPWQRAIELHTENLVTWVPALLLSFTLASQRSHGRHPFAPATPSFCSTLSWNVTPQELRPVLRTTWAGRHSPHRWQHMADSSAQGWLHSWQTYQGFPMATPKPRPPRLFQPPHSDPQLPGDGTTLQAAAAKPGPRIGKTPWVSLGLDTKSWGSPFHTVAQVSLWTFPAEHPQSPHEYCHS